VNLALFLFGTTARRLGLLYSEEVEKQSFELMMEIINLKKALLPLMKYGIQP
jgi:hypothetical protein